MRHRTGFPVRIRGVVYPSIAAAARETGVCRATIERALDDGRIDEIGITLRKVGRRCKPCVYRGQSYPSVTAAAAAHGVSKASVSQANKRRMAMA